jgi:hypothetical protein
MASRIQKRNAELKPADSNQTSDAIEMHLIVLGAAPDDCEHSRGGCATHSCFEYQRTLAGSGRGRKAATTWSERT